MSKVYAYCLVLIPILVVSACSDATGPTPPDDSEPSVDSQAVEGLLSLPTGSAVTGEDLFVASLIGDAGIDAQGRFSVEVPEPDGPSVLFGVGEESSRPVLLAFVLPSHNKSISLDAVETAKALVLTTPIFTGAETADFERAYELLPEASGFPALVSHVEDFLRSGIAVTGGLFDQTVYKDLYSRAFEIGRDVLEANTTADQTSIVSTAAESDDPVFSRGSSGGVTVTNPDLVYRGLEVTGAVDGAEQGWIVPRAETRWRFKWPPIEVVPVEHELGDIPSIVPDELQLYNAWISTGFHIEEVHDFENLAPIGLNLGRMVVFAIRWYLPDPEGLEPWLDDLPQCASNQFGDLSGSTVESIIDALIRARNTQGFSEIVLDDLNDFLLRVAVDCLPELWLHKWGLDEILKIYFGEDIFSVVFDLEDKVEVGTEATLFVRDWLIEDLLRDSPFPDGLGGTFVQRYALDNGKNFQTSRGGAVHFRWTPDVEATLAFDGIATTKEPPLRLFDLRRGEHTWEIAVSASPTSKSGDFQVEKAQWHVVSVGIPFQVSDESTRATQPAVSGDRIVWTDDRWGNLDIFLFDLSTSTETQITGDPADQSYPDISSDRIVWRDDRFGNSDIFLFDASAGTETRITDAIENDTYPAISGDRVVWKRTGNLQMFDFATGTETQIVADAGIPSLPDISGDRIVWNELLPDVNFEIFLLDLSTGAETRLTDNADGQIFPAISDDRVVWTDSRHGNDDIYLLDLSTGAETRITDDVADQIQPAISGDRIVWQDRRNGNWDIYLFDLSASTETQITDDPEDQVEPAISGDRIVWQDRRNGNWNIYLFEIP